MKISRRTRPATAALAVGLVAVPVVLAVSHPATSPAASVAPVVRVPALTVSISISDGHVAARAGDELTYTVSVRDSGAKAVPHLTVTQTLPAELEFLSASDHGVAARGQVSWPASLPAGGTRTFRVVTRVARTPATLLRLAAVACARLPGSSRPLVCAAHLDRLPAAAAEPASPPARFAGNTLAYTVAGLAVLALGLLTAIALRRRGRARRQPA
jgi:uncharacterized repeat protein (TIGR01451 family)